MVLVLARCLVVVLAIGLLSPSIAAAQDNGPSNSVVNAPKAETNAPAQSSINGAEAQEPQRADYEQARPRRTDREERLSYWILGFGVIVLVVQYLLLRTPSRDASSILQLLSINLIVTGTLFLITAGFDAQAIAPGLGLFGTIAGYVLGRRSAEGGNGNPPQSGAGNDNP